MPINEYYNLDFQFLQKNPRAFKFYKEINNFFIQNRKKSSKIESLFENLNYWNKLKKQKSNSTYIIVYNAIGPKLKASVISDEKKRVIVGSENYYYTTESQEEAYYLSAILNAPILLKKLLITKSSKQFHKNPFIFKIPLYNESDISHKELASIAKKCENDVQDLYFNNPMIRSDKIRIIMNRRFSKIDKLTKKIVFE